MNEFHRAATDLKESIKLDTEAVAVSYLQAAPDDVPKYQGKPVPSGCRFWVEARQSTFYTVAEDHYNCPIGTLTQGFSIQEEHAEEAQGLFKMMVDNKYLRNEDLEGVPKITSDPKVITYGPLSQATATPDVVVLACNSYQAMLLSEAIAASGMDGLPSFMGRPTCAALPVTLDTDKPTLSLGCIGNRVYTELADDQMVVTLPGSKLITIVDAVKDMVKTNALLEGAHREKKGAIV